MSFQPVYRNGKVHVLSSQCSTCIFRSGNPMSLEPGRVRSMVDGAVAAESVIPCHKTLGEHAAVCRGYYDAHADRVWTLRLARHLDMIEYQEPPA